jgi:hypothetical protein
MSTASLPERLIDAMRGVRYGEVIALFSREKDLVAEVYGTQLLNDCPQELWAALDPAALAAELGAVHVKLNGPRHWMLDGLGAKTAPIEPVLREFGGILMRRIAVLSLGDEGVPGPYEERKIDRGAIFFFDAGKPVFELIRPDGTAYVMQARCIGVDPGMTETALVELGGRLALPEGWGYRTRVLSEELVIDTSASLATVIQDEFENTYTLPY